MESKEAVAALSALAQPARLEVFRLLVQAGPEGMAAGQIAAAARVPPSTLSANLNILAAAGLVAPRRDGRRIIYVAGYEAMQRLLAFLLEDCCAGRPEICGPLTREASSACAPAVRC